MGKVSFSTYVRVAGCYEPYENVYDYFYCDKCGSFSLESYMPPYTNTQIVVKTTALIGALLISVLVWWFTNRWLLGTLPIITGCLIFISTIRKKQLKCKKCGNNEITSVNVLKYATNDTSLLDVPDELVIKQYVSSIIPAM